MYLLGKKLERKGVTENIKSTTSGILTKVMRRVGRISKQRDCRGEREQVSGSRARKRVKSKKTELPNTITPSSLENFDNQLKERK